MLEATASSATALRSRDARSSNGKATGTTKMLNTVPGLKRRLQRSEASSGQGTQ